MSFDILPVLKGGDSPTESSRLRVSSVVKYAFASHVSGCRPIVTEGVRYSACSRVNAAFRPGHAGRGSRERCSLVIMKDAERLSNDFHGTNIVRPPQRGIQPARYHGSPQPNC